MKTSVFWGCRILTGQYAYEMSLREVLPKLGVQLFDLPESACCGDPVKSVNNFATDYLASRILSFAQSTGNGDLLVPCNRCHFTISETKNIIDKNEEACRKIKSILAEEGLQLASNTRIWHTIDFLHDSVGLRKIKKSVTRPLKGLRFATHVGCQLIRYSDLGRADDAENPRKLDDLVCALGAETVDYAEKLDCCGSALMYSHPDSALSLAGSKLKAVQNLRVDGLVVSCPDCQRMFDAKQKEAGTTVGGKLDLPVIYYTQLLGLALNINEQKLGLHLNQSSIEELLTKISRENPQ